MNSPPRFALHFLAWFCPRSLYEGIEGDLLEQFDKDQETAGQRRARLLFVLHVIRFFRPEIILRNRFRLPLTSPIMIRNYFNIMRRVILKRKAYSVITIFGLVAGITFAMLVGVFITEELSVNKSLKDIDRLYLIENHNKEDNMSFPFMTLSPLSKTMREQYPQQVENYYRFWDRSITVSHGDKHYRIQSIIGDSTLISMFGFPVLHGNAANALDQPNTMAITEKVARQYFGRTDVVGETLTVSTESDGRKEYSITLVLRDLPRNSVSNFLQMDTQIFLPQASGKDFISTDPDAWDGNSMIGYVKLTHGASKTEAEKACQALFDANAPVVVPRNLRMELVPLKDYYLATNHGAMRKLVVTLSAIVAFILLLAVINFVNIAIGSATTRMKEIGVRKTIGGLKRQIAFQFLFESVFMTVVAGCVSLLAYMFLRSFVGNILNTSLPPLFELKPAFWWGGALFIVCTGVLAGAYPAFFLSSFKSIDSLKGKLRLGSGSLNFSRSLIALQFFCAIGIFIFSMIVQHQVAYFLEKDLGYDKSSIVTVSSVPRLWSAEGISKMEAAKHEFLSVPGVISASLSREVPNGNYGTAMTLYAEGRAEGEAVSIPMLMADEDFAKTYRLEVQAGVFFGDAVQPDALVINASTAKLLGVGVGERVKIQGNPTTLTVAGIVKDFNFFTLHQQVGPMVFVHVKNTTVYRYFSFKLQPGNPEPVVQALQAKWRSVFPADPFDYAFMDDRLLALYTTEVQLKKATAMATTLMLVIVLAGILGLVSLGVSQRTKEIGIRKVLGASIPGILLLLSRDYIKIVCISFLVVLPCIYYISSRWLGRFAYPVAVQWWMFAVPFVAVMLLTLVAVGGQSLKTAVTSPAKSLKYE